LTTKTKDTSLLDQEIASSKMTPVKKLCCLALWAASWHFVASEAFAPRNNLWSQKSSLAKSTAHPRHSPVALTNKLERFEGEVLNLRGGEDRTGIWNKKLLREMVAEFIGTFLIVHIGTGAVMSAVFTDSLVGLFQIASVWIIAVTIAICSTASISGAHLNPAVSVAFAMLRPSKSFNWKKVIPYSVAQLFGAVSGSWINLILYSSSITAFESANGIVRASASGIASAKAFGEYFM
jgi:hypothetical protein